MDLGKPSGTVVSYVVDEPTSILVWLVPDGSNLPRAYSFSFETNKALRLQKAFAGARQHGNAVRMEPGGARGKSASLGDAGGDSGGSRSDGSSSSDRTSDGLDFYPAPQRMDPLKADTRE